MDFVDAPSRRPPSFRSASVRMTQWMGVMQVRQQVGTACAKQPANVLCTTFAEGILVCFATCNATVVLR